MHGLTTPKEVFDDLTEQLVSKDFQVLAFDFYGRGMSDHIQPIESEKVANAMIKLANGNFNQNVFESNEIEDLVG